eukprot:TRINITY_DN123443_c0_g1_i1.p1 TRINITY_DN123443_c0_g1~~TRINITY_DN123443_c0_g1_i1.p1  ORF type:complete len:475 (-),score=65.52 TRINITY_DN123443_c0_g1_i1:307-1731(-)
MCARFPSQQSWSEHSWAQVAIQKGEHRGSSLEVTGCVLTPAFNGSYVFSDSDSQWIHEGDPDLICKFDCVSGEKSGSNEFHSRWLFQSKARSDVLPYFQICGTKEPPLGGAGEKAWSHGAPSFRGEDESMRVHYSKRGTLHTVITVLTFNVFGGGDFKQDRLPHIVRAVTEHPTGRPDIICLQEVTQTILQAILEELNAGGGRGEGGDNLSGYSCCWNKLDAVLEQPEKFSKHGYTCKEKIKEDMEEAGYMAILSRFPALESKLVYEGSWLDDGIVKCTMDLCPGSVGQASKLAVYNVHLAGGTYNQDPEKRERKRAMRIEECGHLVQSLQETLGNIGGEGGYSSVLVMGDFNCDANDAKEFPEVKYLPDRHPEVCEHFLDCWQELRSEDGATESKSKNGMRAALKPKQDREARFDRIFLLRANDVLKCASVELFAAEEVGTVPYGDSTIPLFPSDHFGVRAVLSPVCANGVQS